MCGSHSGGSHSGGSHLCGTTFDRALLNSIGQGVLLTLQFVLAEMGETDWEPHPDELNLVWHELARCLLVSTESAEMYAIRAAIEQQADAFNLDGTRPGGIPGGSPSAGGIP